MKMRTGHVEGGFSNSFWQVTLSEKGPPERGGWGVFAFPHLVSPIGPSS